MKTNDHYRLAHEIAYCARTNTRQSLLLLVMNEKEYEFYVDTILDILPDKLITRMQDHRKTMYNIRLENGSEIRILRYNTRKTAFDCWLCGWHIDKWWATTELLPDKITTKLQVCSMLS